MTNPRNALRTLILAVSATCLGLLVMPYLLPGIQAAKRAQPAGRTRFSNSLSPVSPANSRANSDRAGAAPDTAGKVFIPFIGKITLPASPPIEDNWIAHVNYYRGLAALPPVAENTSWSNGNWLHARYSVKNDDLKHSESPGNPWFTPEGNQAAQYSNLFGSFNLYENDATAIAWWISGPFHAAGILNPQLEETGFGSYREDDGGLTMAGGLDVVRGIGPFPASVSFPILFPGSGAVVYLNQFAGEYPDPLTSCLGYTAPAGLPIMLQIGPGDLVPQVTATHLLENGVEVEHCTFDETSYSNPDPQIQSLGRGLLNGRDAIVIIPRDPLVPGASYTVSITTNGTTYTWSFKVAPSAGGPGGSPESLSR